MATKIDLRDREFLDERTEHQGQLKFVNEVGLTIGGVGSGKTTLNAYKSYIRHHHNNSVVLNINDWKGNMENCFTMFYPTESYHLNLLKKQGMKPEQFKTEIYIPFSYSDKSFFQTTHRFPEMHIFSIPIKSFLSNDMILSILFENEKQTTSMSALKNVIQGMEDKESYWDLRYRLRHRSEKELKEILPRLQLLEEDMFLQPENAKTNINLKEMLNDYSYHALIDKSVRDKKLKYMIIAYFLVNIRENIERAKYSLVLVLDEVRGLLPAGAKGFRERFTDFFGDEIVIASRNIGKGVSILMAGQFFDLIHKKVRTSATDHYFGKIDPDTLKSLKKDYAMTKDQIEPYETLIEENKKGRFIRRGHESDDSFTGCVPPHALPEEGITFMEMYKEQYPDKIRDYRDFKEEMEETIKAQHKRYVERKKKDRQARELEALAKEEERRRKAEQAIKKETKETDLRPDRIATLYMQFKDEKNYVSLIMREYEKQYGIRLQHKQVYDAFKKKGLVQKSKKGETHE